MAFAGTSASTPRGKAGFFPLVLSRFAGETTEGEAGCEDSPLVLPLWGDYREGKQDAEGLYPQPAKFEIHLRSQRSGS